ncbi:MAG: hypothetical protein GEU75_07480 [Dehalococcoidia bacterium]|nr:hypothetical protein [Dehalococcoidia bacterium]
MEELVSLSVRVTPRSSRDEVVGWRDDLLLVRLRAAPVEGQANEALRRLVAKKLGVAVSDVGIAGGATSRTKRLRIRGLETEAVRARLGR